MIKVIIERGLPGSGKNLYIESLAAATGAKLIVCSADEFFTKDGGDYLENFNPALLSEAHKFCFDRFVKACDAASGWVSGDYFIAVANTNTCLFEMAPYIMYAQLRDLDVEIHEVSVPYATVEDYQSFNTHGVPLFAIEGMIARREESLPFWPPVTKVESLRDVRKFAYLEEDSSGVQVRNGERYSYGEMIPAV